MTRLVIGYEIATRAGLALHASVSDYHTSGAWNALAAAAIGARALKLDADWTRHALGIAEYNGPRSQMMRCIDHPTMVKDGSGWGRWPVFLLPISRRRPSPERPRLPPRTRTLPICGPIWATAGAFWAVVLQTPFGLPMGPATAAGGARPAPGVRAVLRPRRGHQSNDFS